MRKLIGMEDGFLAAKKAGGIADQWAIADAIEDDAFERDADKVYEFALSGHFYIEMRIVEMSSQSFCIIVPFSFNVKISRPLFSLPVRSLSLVVLPHRLFF